MGEVTPLHQAAITTAFAAVLFFLGRPQLKHVISRILDEALNRTSFPLAAWDCYQHYQARLCIFAAASWGPC